MYKYPYGDSQQLNLDWILAKIKELEESGGAGGGTDLEEVSNALISLTYNSSTAYQRYDYAFYNGKLYRAIANTTGAFNPTDWREVQLGNDVAILTRLVNAIDASVTTLQGQMANLDSDDVDNASNVTGDTVSDALDNLNSAIKAFKIINVAADGTGDYTTISDAVTAANDNDIIFIHEGTYVESVDARGKKLYIIGVDQSQCVLQYSGLDYAHPPLMIAQGYVSNLTINALNYGEQGQQGKAYCVHIDYDEEQNKNLTFEKCTFFNSVYQGVGIGLRPHFTLEFKDCYFQTFNYAALYCHDWETADTSADKTGQIIRVKNSLLINNSASEPTIRLQSQELATDCAQCMFIKNVVNNLNANGTKIGMILWNSRTLTNNSFLGSSDWTLDGSSSMNTVEDCNSVGYPLSRKDWNLFNRFQFFSVNASNPIDIPVRQWNGGILLANLQGIGFVFLQIYHNPNSVIVTDVVSGSAFSNAAYSFAVNGYEYIRMTTTNTDASTLMMIAPNVI